MISEMEASIEKACGPQRMKSCREMLTRSGIVQGAVERAVGLTGRGPLN